MNERIGLAVCALILVALFAMLGAYVTRRPLGVWDARAVYFRGKGTALALLFTISGRSRALVFGYAAATLAFAIFHLPLWIPLGLAASQVISQGVAELAKSYYRRTRPDYWLVGLDAGHSYPSGHATTAVTSYAGWACVCALSTFALPAKVTLVVFLFLWAAGIMWSRLALGAHYLSDVAGGLLLGSAWLCIIGALLATSGLLGRV
ncbi:MAG TPA: phosphatase PAP2 family protein [Candidatus Baltobacteraceae bacterium]|nr:phosphatase PAP2 family protein [Candidatus Baltobacteraceae bacterium]